MSTYTIRQDKKYKDMYYVVYPDGELSFDFYNLPRAVDHKNLLSNERNKLERVGTLQNVRLH